MNGFSQVEGEGGQQLEMNGFSLHRGNEFSKLQSKIDYVPVMQVFDGVAEDPSTGRQKGVNASVPANGTLIFHKHTDCGNFTAGTNLGPFRELSKKHHFQKILISCSDHTHTAARGGGTATTFITTTFHLKAPVGTKFPLSVTQQEQLGTHASLKLQSSGIKYTKQRGREGPSTITESEDGTKTNFTTRTKTVSQHPENILRWLPPGHSELKPKDHRVGAEAAKLHREVEEQLLRDLYETGTGAVRFHVIETSKNLGMNLFEMELSIGGMVVTSSPLYTNSTGPKQREVAETEDVSEMVRELKGKFSKLPNFQAYFAKFEQVLNCASLSKECALDLGKEFEGLDTDKNGTVSKVEVKAAMDRHSHFDEETMDQIFKKADTNKDGELDKDEYLSCMAESDLKNADAVTLFHEIDTDGDGSVTIEEVTAFFTRFTQGSVDTREIKAMFTAVDTGGPEGVPDGEIDFVEFAQALGQGNAKQTMQDTQDRLSWQNQFRQKVRDVAAAAEAAKNAQNAKFQTATGGTVQRPQKKSPRPTQLNRESSYDLALQDDREEFDGGCAVAPTRVCSSGPKQAGGSSGGSGPVVSTTAVHPISAAPPPGEYIVSQQVDSTGNTNTQVSVGISIFSNGSTMDSLSLLAVPVSGTGDCPFSFGQLQNEFDPDLQDDSLSGGAGTGAGAGAGPPRMGRTHSLQNYDGSLGQTMDTVVVAPSADSAEVSVIATGGGKEKEEEEEEDEKKAEGEEERPQKRPKRGGR